MGFFGALGKVLSGKPVYSPQDQSVQQEGSQLMDDTQTAAQPGQQPGQVAGKVVPVIRFGRIENQWDGPRLDVWADAGNESEVPVFIDWVTMLGAKRQLDLQLRPGQERQVLVYSGPLLQNHPGGYAEVQYRTAEDRDYFMNYHEIRSEQEEGGLGWRITEMIQRGPVKDMR